MNSPIFMSIENALPFAAWVNVAIPFLLLVDSWIRYALYSASHDLCQIPRSGGNRRIKQAGILVRNSIEIVLSESIPLLQIADGGTKGPLRHIRTVQPHEQLRRRHQLTDGAQLRPGCTGSEIVVEERKSLLDLLGSKRRPIGTWSERQLERLKASNKVRDGSTGVRGDHSDVRKASLCASEYHIREHARGIEHELKHRRINLEVDSQRSVRDYGMH